jgi:hypothetical protein
MAFSVTRSLCIGVESSLVAYFYLSLNPSIFCLLLMVSLGVLPTILDSSSAINVSMRSCFFKTPPFWSACCFNY